MATYAAHGWPVALRPSGIALQASWFDLLELPSPAGAMIHHALLTRIATATMRPAQWWRWLDHNRLRWLFVVEGGVCDAGRVEAAGGLLYSGPDVWVPAPPSRTPDGMSVGWVVPPQQARWRPYGAADNVFDRLGLTATGTRSLPRQPLDQAAIRRQSVFHRPTAGPGFPGPASGGW
ncbi:hypothetical protein [Micromonospora sonneratiae]|uniref:hypothetical protein n=1 Tax=Micromonospora sonneratiae TaxID=1184706 RepID=UPI00366EB32E